MLQLTGLHAGYGRTSVVHGVDLEVPDDAVVAVLGHNGAGKTTLLRTVVGLLRPHAGAVLLDVGVSRVVDPETDKKKLTGDIDPAAAETASWISPNPGGVGPMTRAMLLVNVVESCERAVSEGA